MTFVPRQILTYLYHKSREKEMNFIKGKRNMYRSFRWKMSERDSLEDKGVEGKKKDTVSALW
jgi:hypothetical protein